MSTETFSQDFFDALLADALEPTPPTKEQMIAALQTEIKTFQTEPVVSPPEERKSL